MRAAVVVGVAAATVGAVVVITTFAEHFCISWGCSVRGFHDKKRYIVDVFWVLLLNISFVAMLLIDPVMLRGHEHACTHTLGVVSLLRWSVRPGWAMGSATLPGARECVILVRRPILSPCL